MNVLDNSSSSTKVRAQYLADFVNRLASRLVFQVGGF